MKFPGSRLLYEVDLAARRASLDDLLRSCQQVGLTGFAELKTPDGAGMIFYYLGSAANTLVRCGPDTLHGSEAMQTLRRKAEEGDGTFAVYELPLDMAHLLRGITNRRKLPDPLAGKADLDKLLERAQMQEHTGAVEIQTRAGAGMLLLVRGRVSNLYWETADGLTFEKGEARQRIEASLGSGRAAEAYQSDFSPQVWKGRHEMEGAVPAAPAPTPRGAEPTSAEVAAEEAAARRATLEELQRQVPALVQGVIFDLLTGAVLERRMRGPDALRVALLAERVPAFTLYLRDLVAAAQDDEVELLEVATSRIALLVAIVREAQEAIALFADKSQPTALMAAALGRVARTYAARLHPARGALAGW